MGKIILVRHGETELNVRGIYFGHMDPPLNEKGKDQAQKAMEILKDVDYDKIYTSDLNRAFETANIVNHKNIELVSTESLREINFGIFEGYSYKELQEKYPEELRASEDWRNYNYITGESVTEMQNRAIKFIDDVVNLDETTVLVSHWGPINTILSYYISSGLDSYWKYSVENGGVVVLEFSDGHPILKGFNIGG